MHRHVPLQIQFQVKDTDISNNAIYRRDRAVTHQNVHGDQMQPGLADIYRLRAIRQGDASAKIQFKGQDTPKKEKTGFNSVESDINAYASKLIKRYLEENNVDKSSVQITPFKIKERSGKKGGAVISHGIDQAAQLADFESWAGPGNQLLNWM